MDGLPGKPGGNQTPNSKHISSMAKQGWPTCLVEIGLFSWSVSKPGRDPSYCGWLRNPCTTWKQWLKPLFVGICKGIIIPGCLRWCRILSIHSSNSFMLVLARNPTGCTPRADPGAERQQDLRQPSSWLSRPVFVCPPLVDFLLRGVSAVWR